MDDFRDAEWFRQLDGTTRIRIERALDVERRKWSRGPHGMPNDVRDEVVARERISIERERERPDLQWVTREEYRHVLNRMIECEASPDVDAETRREIGRERNEFMAAGQRAGRLLTEASRASEPTKTRIMSEARIQSDKLARLYQDALYVLSSRGLS